jgi:hypothetical protein
MGKKYMGTTYDLYALSDGPWKGSVVSLGIWSWHIGNLRLLSDDMCNSAYELLFGVLIHLIEVNQNSINI